MKTTINNASSIKTSATRLLRTGICVIFFALASGLVAQEEEQPVIVLHPVKAAKVHFFNYGINAGISVSGNGLANSLGVGFSLIHSRSRLTLGSGIQGQKHNLSGYSAAYDYTLNPKGEGYRRGVELFLTVSGNYHMHCFLSQQAASCEKTAQGDGDTDYTDVRLNVIDAYGGMGARIALSKHFKLMTRISVGEYYTLPGAPSMPKMYRQNQDICLKLGASIAYVF